MRSRSPHSQWLAVLVAFALASDAWAQGARARLVRIEEPQWLRLQISDVQLGVAMEANHSDTSFQGSAQSVTYSRYFVGPELTLALNGTIYHSNLIQFNFIGGGAYGWAEQRVKSGERRSSQNEMQFLGNFHSSMFILPNKPLNGNIFTDYTHSYREFDIFTRTTVESRNYGTRLAYENLWLNLGAGYARAEEDSTGSFAPTSATQDVMDFNARNTRHNGATTINYSQTQTSRGGAAMAEALNRNLSLADTEMFGSNANFQANATWSQYDSTDGALEDQYQATTTLGLEHSRTLQSNYAISYSQFEAPGFNSQNYGGHADLQHQLYGSLHSALLADFSMNESRAGANSGYMRTYGGGVTESYTKRLGRKHRLTIHGAFYLNRVAQDNTGRVLNEEHAFPAPPADEAFFLRQLDVIESTIIVTSTDKTQTFSPVTDYEIFTNGSQTGIRRRLPGSTIPEGSAVLVDYRAEPVGAGEYELASENFGVRLNLFGDFCSVFARVHHNDNTAPAKLRIPTQTAYTIGTELRYRRLSATAEYEVFDSTDSDYTTLRFSQGGSWVIDPLSSWGVGLGESFTKYGNSRREEENYRLTATYRRSLGSSLRGDAVAGLAYRNTTDMEQLLAVLRHTLTYQIGQTYLHLMYDFTYDMYVGNQERMEHNLQLRIRRNF